MRLVALAITGAVLALACSGAVAGDPADARPAAQLAPHVLVDEGGILRPLENGGRVALRSGWATVRFASMPIGHVCDLQVMLFEPGGATVAGEVSARYESLDMDHGRAIAPSTFEAGAHRMRLSFQMPGRWMVVLSVARGDSQETITLVLPAAGT